MPVIPSSLPLRSPTEEELLSHLAPKHEVQHEIPSTDLSTEILRRDTLISDLAREHRISRIEISLAKASVAEAQRTAHIEIYRNRVLIDSMNRLRISARSDTQEIKTLHDKLVKLEEATHNGCHCHTLPMHIVLLIIKEFPECPICMEELTLENFALTHCGHAHCKSCLYGEREGSCNYSCPPDCEEEHDPTRLEICPICKADLS
jgi:hypothetical protein